MNASLEKSRRDIRRLEELPAGLASQILLEEDLKPVMRELHPVGETEAAAARWRQLGYATAQGDEVLEEQLTGAMVSRENTEYTVRPLRTHPVIARLLDLGGAFAERWLLAPESPIHQALAKRYQADITPERPQEGSREVTPKSAVYISKSQTQADRARALDRMGHDAQSDHTAALGALLGYPACCVAAFSRLERRWPNRIPIHHAARRTTRFMHRLNNLSLARFSYISWFPCGYDCAESLALADRVAEILGALNPALIDAVDAVLATPRIYWDDRTQAVLINPRRAGGAWVYDGVEDLQAVWACRSAPEPDPRITALAGSRRVTGNPWSPSFDGQPASPEDGPLLLPFSA